MKMSDPPTHRQSATPQAIAALAEPQGFSLVGIAPAEPASRADYFRQWLAQGKHGEMSYLAKDPDRRIDPARQLAGARWVICVADLYDGYSRPTRPAGAVGRIARYAWGNDYHRVIKRRLHRLADGLRRRWPDEQYQSAVDTAPVFERDHAVRAGLGWIGKHTLLIHPRLGSWLLLGQIITTLEVAPALPNPTTDHCGTCTRCIDACPTDCIDPRGYRMDASRCISYLTIEHRGPIAPQLHRPIGDWIAGCDICQDVCPFNQRPLPEPASGSAADLPPVNPAYAPRPPGPGIGLQELIDWDVPTRQTAFEGSALKRIKLDQLKRNALIAAGNYLTAHPDSSLRAVIEGKARDATESELVRVTAQQVLKGLGGN